MEAFIRSSSYLTLKPLLLFSYFVVFYFCIFFIFVVSVNKLFHYVGEFLVCSLKRASLTLIKQVDEDAIIKSCPVKYVFS